MSTARMGGAPARVARKAAAIRLVLTDCDGVLTDGGAWYTERGEELKRFSLRDGMGVERLRRHAGIETGLVTRETRGPARSRAMKLGLPEIHTGVLDKGGLVARIAGEHGLDLSEVAFLGDDANDLAALELAGLSACPADAFSLVRESVDYVCDAAGGHGAFRELAELILLARLGEIPRD